MEEKHWAVEHPFALAIAYVVVGILNWQGIAPRLAWLQILLAPVLLPLLAVVDAWIFVWTRLVSPWLERLPPSCAEHVDPFF